MGMGGSSMNLWQELLPGDNGKPINDLLKKQYDVVYGSWPNSYDEIVLVLDENNELDDMTLYALGLRAERRCGQHHGGGRQRQGTEKRQQELVL